MQFNRDEALNARSLVFEETDRLSKRVLVFDFTRNSLYSVKSHAEYLQVRLKKIHRDDAKVEIRSATVDTLSSLQKLAREIPRFDTVQIFFDGAISISKSVLLPILISRFYGKEIALFYYPENELDQIPKMHLRMLSLCSNVIVSSRYEQRLLSKFKINSEVNFPPLKIDWPVRRISELQPHVLIAHDPPNDPGAECIISAFKMVKDKYPRTMITNITSNMIDWQMSFMQKLRATHGDFYANPHNIDDVRSAFAQADIFVNCSSAENAPATLLAAMATGLPCISFESYGAREIIDNSRNGFLIRHNDHNQLADRIIELIEQPELVLPVSTMAAKFRSSLNLD